MALAAECPQSEPRPVHERGGRNERAPTSSEGQRARRLRRGRPRGAGRAGRVARLHQELLGQLAHHPHAGGVPDRLRDGVGLRPRLHPPLQERRAGRRGPAADHGLLGDRAAEALAPPVRYGDGHAPRLLPVQRQRRLRLRRAVRRRAAGRAPQQQQHRGRAVQRLDHDLRGHHRPDHALRHAEPDHRRLEAGGEVQRRAVGHRRHRPRHGALAPRDRSAAREVPGRRDLHDAPRGDRRLPQHDHPLRAHRLHRPGA
jgi:hypothetical protein